MYTHTHTHTFVYTLRIMCAPCTCTCTTCDVTKSSVSSCFIAFKLPFTFITLMSPRERRIVWSSLLLENFKCTTFFRSSLEEIPYSSVQTSELQYRLGSLEERVKRLEEGGMSRASSSSSGPGRFWYALTFSSWMMVPLIVVFLMYYKRQN